jgi:hypothetical protein
MGGLKTYLRSASRPRSSIAPARVAGKAAMPNRQVPVEVAVACEKWQRFSLPRGPLWRRDAPRGIGGELGKGTTFVALWRPTVATSS